MANNQIHPALDRAIRAYAESVRDIRDLLATQLEDHAPIAKHEERIRALEELLTDNDDEE